jgi:hypothetical protein
MPKTDAPVDIMKCLPDDWDEEDKLDYKVLSIDSKKYFPEMEDFIIHIGVIAYINDVKKGKKQEVSQEDIDKVRLRYDNSSNILYTPYDANFYENVLPNIYKEKEETISINNLSSDIIEEEVVNEQED